MFAAHEVVGVRTEFLTPIQCSHAHKPHGVSESRMLGEQQHSALRATPRAGPFRVGQYVSLATLAADPLYLRCLESRVDRERRACKPLAVAAMTAIDGTRLAGNPISQSSTAAAADKLFIANARSNLLMHARSAQVTGVAAWLEGSPTTAHRLWATYVRCTSSFRDGQRVGEVVEMFAAFYSDCELASYACKCPGATVRSDNDLEVGASVLRQCPAVDQDETSAAAV